MSLRESTSDKLGHKVEPDAMKDDHDRAAHNVRDKLDESVIRHFPPATINNLNTFVTPPMSPFLRRLILRIDAASYLPRQGLARDNVDSGAADHHNFGDTGRQGPSAAFDALKPSGQQTTGEAFKRQTDKLASEIQPNSTKSDGQALRDAATLGNDSGKPAGFTQQVTDAAAGVKDAVVNAFKSDKE
ncbi:hypothetical protein TREMEDRAFT_64207 [Tremella mesenterica DSM 1558]|uniref:uncharacterized protein n=1 Tax=Tremella mesenterica (strain ATCC 24925 / CBS 8224 / DSM 1558 / NBRC 9311 / NRRL Y-6157 / RJB 2259-6 / UBC 559-6) TaxID=578456 RepID=UPI0003F49E9E|nr:uncharacterized protein TREMEDRAFT_64207 [Tremella mesenterica DSM 1558]EIW67616.1 hypothetical protein TREMEDRAFT_64207 [Tremella mesenterica DSM 1558]